MNNTELKATLLQEGWKNDCRDGRNNPWGSLNNYLWATHKELPQPAGEDPVYAEVYYIQGENRYIFYGLDLTMETEGIQQEYKVGEEAEVLSIATRFITERTTATV